MAKKKTEILNIYKDFTDRFAEEFSNLKNDVNQKNIHKMRTTIKKLRAFWLFAEILSMPDPSSDNHSLAVKPMFKNLGQIREAQINQKLASKFSGGPIKRYINHLKHLEKAAMEHFLQEFNVSQIKDFISVDESLDKTLQTSSVQQLKRASSSCIRLELEKIREKITLLPDKEVLHDIRKHLKVITSTLTILQSLGLKDSRLAMYKTYKNLSEKIGAWHDDAEFYSSLEAFRDNSDRFKNSRIIRQSLKAVDERQNRLQRKLRKQLILQFSEDADKKSIKQSI